MKEQDNVQPRTQNGGAPDKREAVAASELVQEIERPRFREKQTDFCAIDSDAEIFSETLSSEYPILGDISEMLASGNNTVTFDQHIVSKKIDEEWVKAIEDGMIYLDEAIRNPRVEIIEVEEIMPIELTKSVSERSIKHLSQHTDMINDYDPETGEVTPTKILNVFKEDNMLTYENKFVNTLIRTLHSFINRRYKELAKQNILSGSRLELRSDFKTPTADGKMVFSIELTEAARETSAKSKTVYYDPLLKRIEKLYDVISGYMTSEFAKALGNNTVRPPVKRTNAISKNKNLRQCLALWDYIQGYHKIGYEIEQQQISGEPDGEYLEKLYSMLSLQYVTYKATLEKNLEPDEWDAEGAELPYSLDGGERECDDYGIYDPPYARVVPVSRFIKQPKISARENELQNELLVALNASYYFERIAPILGAERLKRYFSTGMTIGNVLDFAEITRQRRAQEIMISSERKERLLKKENEYLALKAKKEAEKHAREELMQTIESIARAEAIRAMNKRRLKERNFRRIAERAERRQYDMLALPFVRAAIAEMKKADELNRKYYDFAKELSGFEADLVWEAHVRKITDERNRRAEALREADAECSELISDTLYLFEYENEQLEENEMLALIAAEDELNARLKREAEKTRLAQLEEQKKADEIRRREAERAAAEAERRRLEEEAKIKAVEERQRREDDDRKAAAERRRLEEEAKIKAAEERQRREEAEREAAAERRRLEEEAKRKAEADRQRRLEEEAERRAEAERQRQLKEEAERRAEAERQRQLKEEAERRAEAERQRQLKEEAERRAEAERQRQLKEEAERRAEAERQRQLKEEAEAERQRQLKEEAEKEAEAERQRQLKAKAEKEAEDERKQKEADRRRLIDERRQKAEEQKKKNQDDRLRKIAEAKRLEDERNKRIIVDGKRREDEARKQREDAGALGALKKGFRSLFRNNNNNNNNNNK